MSSFFTCRLYDWATTGVPVKKKKKDDKKTKAFYDWATTGIPVKTYRSAWLLWLSHNNSFAPKAFLVIGDIHLALFALKIPINFVGNKKNCFFY